MATDQAGGKESVFSHWESFLRCYALALNNPFLETFYIPWHGRHEKLSILPKGDRAQVGCKRFSPIEIMKFEGKRIVHPLLFL